MRLGDKFREITMFAVWMTAAAFCYQPVHSHSSEFPNHPRASVPPVPPNDPPPVPVTCDDLFEERTDLKKAKEAFTCYEAAVKARIGDANERRLAQEGAFHSALWLYNHLSGQMERANVVSRAQGLAFQVIKDAPKDAIGYYWNAVFSTMSCQLVDEGKLIPSCFLAIRKDVITNLETTRTLELSLEGTGGSRFLGLLYTQLPKILGGNKKKGEDFLIEALTQSPDYSTNFLALGRFYINNKRKPEGTKILNDFLLLNCMTMNPERAPECGLDQDAAKKLLMP